MSIKRVKPRFSYKDIATGSISLIFVLAALFVIDKIMWVPALFFGFILFTVIFKNISPNNRYANPNVNKMADDELFIYLYSPGIFEYTEEGFYIEPEDDLLFRWSDINKIIAYKEDYITTDSVYLSLYFDNTEKLTINEETPGWHQFITQMEKQKEINKIWFRQVCHPPFERDETVIYDKSKITFNQ